MTLIEKAALNGHLIKNLGKRSNTKSSVVVESDTEGIDSENGLHNDICEVNPDLYSIT